MRPRRQRTTKTSKYDRCFVSGFLHPTPRSIALRFETKGVHPLCPSSPSLRPEPARQAYAHTRKVDEISGCCTARWAVRLEDVPFSKERTGDDALYVYAYTYILCMPTRTVRANMLVLSRTVGKSLDMYDINGESLFYGIAEVLFRSIIRCHRSFVHHPSRPFNPPPSTPLPLPSPSQSSNPHLQPPQHIPIPFPFAFSLCTHHASSLCMFISPPVPIHPRYSSIPAPIRQVQLPICRADIERS